jgi:hypothetical protein
VQSRNECSGGHRHGHCAIQHPRRRRVCWQSGQCADALCEPTISGPLARRQPLDRNRSRFGSSATKTRNDFGDRTPPHGAARTILPMSNGGGPDPSLIRAPGSAAAKFAPSIGVVPSRWKDLDRKPNSVHQSGGRLSDTGWAAQLYESPFTDFSPRGVEGVFDSGQVTQLFSILDSIRQAAAV